MKNIKLFLTKLMVLFVAVFSVNSLVFAGNGFKYDPSGLELFKTENRELVKKLLEDGDNPETAYVFVKVFHNEIGKEFLKVVKNTDGDLKAVKDKDLSKEDLDKLRNLLIYVRVEVGKSIKQNLNNRTFTSVMNVAMQYNLKNLKK